MACTVSMYDTLEIHTSASTEEVKKAYKRLAVQHHPDKNPVHESQSSHEKFQKIKRAYEILSDEEKRRVYDQKGLKKVEEFERRGHIYSDSSDDDEEFGFSFHPFHFPGRSFGFNNRSSGDGFGDLFFAHLFFSQFMREEFCQHRQQYSPPNFQRRGTYNEYREQRNYERQFFGGRQREEREFRQPTNSSRRQEHRWYTTGSKETSQPTRKPTQAPPPPPPPPPKGYVQ